MSWTHLSRRTGEPVVYRAFESFLEFMIRFGWRSVVFIHELKNIFLKRKLVRQVHLQDEEIRLVKAYWKELTGHNIPLWWHRLYTSYTGNFDHRFIPEIIFSVKMERNASRRCDRDCLDDKNMLGYFVWTDDEPYFRLPKEWLSCMNGQVLDEKNLHASIEASLPSIADIGACVIKKSRGTSSGRDVHFANLKEGIDLKTGHSALQILSDLGDNWVVQETLRQHETLATLYSGAINTLRIVTYHISGGEGGRIGSCPVALRIGQGGASVDNAHAGGMFIAVSKDGNLADEAYTEYQNRYSHHPDTGICFSGYRIVGVDKAIRAAVNAHRRSLQFGFISWDVSINEAGNPVLIEVNLQSQTVWFPQMASGEAMFGEDTTAVVTQYFKYKRL
jgi:hypothetical protein